MRRRARLFPCPFIATHLSTLHTNVRSVTHLFSLSFPEGRNQATQPWSPARACTEWLHRWGLTSQITRGRAGRRQGGARPTALPAPLPSVPILLLAVLSPVLGVGEGWGLGLLSSIRPAWSSEWTLDSSFSSALFSCYLFDYFFSRLVPHVSLWHSQEY